MVASGKLEKSKPPVYHASEQARGWRILRQHVKLRVDLDERVMRGTAMFNLCAVNYQFVSVALNLRRCKVTSCTINGLPAPFRLVSPLDDDELLEAVSSEKSRNRIRDVERSMALREDAAAAQGELLIDLPASVSADIIEDLDDVSANAPKPPGIQEEGFDPSQTLPVPLDQLPVVNLVVEYETLDHTTGAVFYGNHKEPNSVIDPVYLLTESRFGMARFWMPCVDSKNWCDRHLIDIDVAVKPHLMAIASGELMETTLHPGASNSHSKGPVKVFKYRLHAPAHASEIILAVGPFIALPDPILSKTVTHFCLPGHARELVHTSPPLCAKALAFCREYFGSEPPISSFKHVFVGSLGSQSSSNTCGAGGIVVYSGDLLHTSRNIDEGLEAREAILSAFVTSYFGRFLRPRASEDDWLVCGLAAHVTALGLQAILGRNWYRFRILDLMDELCTETSCDLSDIQIDRITDSELISVQRRSHIIVYMIEKRIGSDVLKRALRDIVAEGRSVTIAILKLIDSILSSNTSKVDNEMANGSETANGAHMPRILTDLNGNDPEQSGSGVVSSGFDEAQQGVGVGPFLKRLRAICGTDVRGLVRLWAASRGVPRIQVAYQYNPRRHCLELALRQNGVLQDAGYGSKAGLLFTGTLHVRVMEVEGASDHTVEVRDPYCLAELPCHSRRAKHKSGSQAEKEFNENPARASPVLWVRIDPDTEWCKDLKFQQSEDSWTALLKGERDAIAQYEACRGLCDSGNDMSVKALFAVMEDEQLYWRVRAMAARALATCKGGLEMLLRYFRLCYTDSNDGNTGLVRPNNFSSLSDYFVKRSIVKAIAEVRVRKSTALNEHNRTIPIEAADFLSHILSANDNAGNEFDDDHYVVDLVNTCGKVGVMCVGEEMHAAAGEDGSSTTDAIKKQLERYRSIEQLMPTRSGRVSVAIARALCDIEIADMVYKQRKESGGLLSSKKMPLFQGNEGLLHSIQELLMQECPQDVRLGAMKCLARAYSGDLNIALWLLNRCDRSGSGKDMIEVQRAKEQKALSDWAYVESPLMRYKVLDALTAATSTAWGTMTSPLTVALRRNTKDAIEVCLRILRLVVGDSDRRMRSSALRFAKHIWGLAVPVCLLGRAEYSEAKRMARERRNEQSEIAPLKTHGSFSQSLPLSTVNFMKPSKPSKAAKSSKSGKSSKGSKKKLSIPKSAISAVPLSQGKPGEVVPIDIDDVDSTPRIREEGGIDALEDEPKLTPVVDLDPEPVLPSIKVPKSVAMPATRSVPLSAPVSASKKTEAEPVTTKGDTNAVKASGLRSTKIVLPRSVPKVTPGKPPRAVPHASAKAIPRSIPKVGSTPQLKSVPKSVAVAASSKTNSKSVPKSMPITLPRSVPKVPLSAPNNGPISKAIPKYPFPWHPLDSEDAQLLIRAFDERKSRLAKEDRLAPGSAEYENSKDKTQSAANSSFVPNGTDPEKKKKKKKKKRHLEGEEGYREKKKKKKKKKHKEDSDILMDREPDFGDDFLSQTPAPARVTEGASSTGQKKLGKFKIKLSSVAPVENNS